MQLNELFEQFSIETIVDKTNIPKEKLEDLKNRDWNRFKRAQALGFLNILEREFNTNLNSAKEECKSFFAEQTPQHTSASIDFVESQIAQSNNGGVVSKLIGIVTIAALGYTGWYYYNKQNPNFSITNETNTTSVKESTKQEQNSSDNINSKRAETKEGIIKQEEKVEKTEEKKDIQENKQQSNQKFNITPEAQTTQTQEDNNETPKDSVVKEPVEANTVYNNTTIKSSENSVKKEVELLLNENNKSLEKNNSAKEDNQTAYETTESNIEANSSEDSNISNEESLFTDTNNDQQNEDKLPDSIKLVVNSKKLWLGIYNIDTGKRSSKIIKKSTTLDLTNGKLAIITGHSKFSLVTDNETKKFENRGKSYLLISKEDGIKELTRKEYKELTKRRAF